MKFADFEQKYGKNLVITSHLLELQEKNMPYLRRLISEWKKKKWLLELKKGMYVIHREYYKNRLNPYYIANLIYFPSYISMETALSFYNLIPEGVFSITSVSSKKTNHFKNEFGDFSYASVKSSLFFGYRFFQEGEQKYFFATKEKALLDFLYLNIKNISLETDIIQVYRLQNLDTLNINKFKEYLKLFKHKKLTKIANNLLDNFEKQNYQKL